MRNDIIRKLRDHLARPLDTECAVVYLLAEVRKVLERDHTKPPALWMRCHWALHVDLTKTRTTCEFLRPVDDYIVNTIAGFQKDPNYRDQSGWLFRELSFSDSFRGQLREFFEIHGLPTALCDDERSWAAFLSVYAKVTEDGGLSARSGKLRAIDKVVFKRGRMPIAADGLFDFIVQWDIHLKDGRVVRAGFEPKANLKLLTWGFQIIEPPGFKPILARH